MSLLIFAALHALLKRRHRDGSVVVAYFALYAVYRFANDSFRAGATSRVIVAGLTDGQLVAAIAVPVLLVVLVLLNRRRASRAT
jgi:prolipoprotein diacylglyceryltransferase